MALVYSANPLFVNTEDKWYQFKWQWYMEGEKKPSGNYIFYHMNIAERRQIRLPIYY